MKPLVRPPVVLFMNAAVLVVSAAMIVQQELPAWRRARARTEAARLELGDMKALVGKKAVWETIRDELAPLLPRFPADRAMDIHWLALTDQIAAKHGLKIARRQVGDEKSYAGFREMMVECTEWEGSEEALLHFLFEIQSEGALVDVPQLLMKPLKDDRLRGRFSVRYFYQRAGDRVPVSGSPRAKRSSSPASTGFAKGGFARYQPILDRKVFGSAPAMAMPAGAPGRPTPPPVLPPAFAKNLKVVALVDDPDGIRVGFIDISHKPPKNYLLRIGESQDGYEVLDADTEKEGVLLRKGDMMYWIYMGGSSAPVASAVPAGAGTSPERSSYAERLKARREALKKRQEQAPNVGPDELEKQLRKHNMELIRAGGKLGPPLPIQLTPEEDAQLVQEGVLPAR